MAEHNGVNGGVTERGQTIAVARSDDTVSETERWFLDRGLPHFIDDYSAGTDIWTRALPALTFLVLVEVAVLAPSKEFPVWFDGIVIAAAYAVLLGAWALVNRRRGRRPLQRPDDVGPIEIAAFVIGPALVPLLASSQIRQAIGVALLNVVLLGAIYVGTSYGVVAMARWGLRVLRRQLGAVVSLLGRALPMIALLVTFLFLTQEVWQTAGSLVGPTYWVAVLLFPLVGVSFLLSRVPRDVGSLNDFTDVDGDAFNELVAPTPIAPVAVPPEAGTPAPLGRREWINVGLVSLFSQGIQILLVSLVIGLFFVLLGLLLVNEKTTLAWSGSVNVLATLDAGNSQLVVTEQLLRVAGFLTAFSGLNFTVYLLTDQTYREEFRTEVVGELRQAFAVRAAYLRYIVGLGRESSTISPT
jgi:hypothetical protein